MKKILIYLLLTALCSASAYADGDDGIVGIPPSPPTLPGPSVSSFTAPTKSILSSKNTAPQITYAKGYISVYTVAYRNIIVRVQATDGTVLYESVMTQNTLTIDARNWNTHDYDVVILIK